MQTRSRSNSAFGASRIRISIDRGGTFTDVHAIVPHRRPDPHVIIKLLSVDPNNYKDAPTEGIRRVLELATECEIPRGQSLDLSPIESIRMGTTVATNALLERKGAREALMITKGFKDLLDIGTQARPNIFDLKVEQLGVLYEKVIEIDERVTLWSEDYHELKARKHDSIVRGVTGEQIEIVKKPNIDKIREHLRNLWHEGFRSLAIAFLHSYTYPEHEQTVGRLAATMGFSVALSSELNPMIKIVSRGMSATADAYLTPVIKNYITSVSSNFKGGGFEDAKNTRCEFMQSDGGLADFRRFSGLRAILSGPAGGIVGYAQTAYDEKEQIPLIGFDMGGTSTDVSRYAGTYEHVFETTTAGVSIQAPQLDIHTVAAGGGSILFWRNGLFDVGPESASAQPGPTCYRKGGPLTITDANLLLGRLLPKHFPKIFGPNENEELDVAATRARFNKTTEKISLEQKRPYKPEDVALGFLSVANESMARPIRALTEARGYDTSVHHLACFGGAGGQHACDVANVLGIRRVIIHKYSSTLSAYGMSLADVVNESSQPTSDLFSAKSLPSFKSILNTLAANSEKTLEDQGFQKKNIKHELYLNMRHLGTSAGLMILKPSDVNGREDWNFAKAFLRQHRVEFGFTDEGKDIVVDDARVRSIASTSNIKEKSPSSQMQETRFKDINPNDAKETKHVYLPKADSPDACWFLTPVYQLGSLAQGCRIHGPAVIIDQTQTIIVIPGAIAHILQNCVVIDIKKKSKEQTSEADSSDPGSFSINPIRLSIFANRFMSIAEQMGRVLQKTSVSTNIKERLDFSCALFSPDGGLVANAPHVPVHLGSMQFAVRFQHNFWTDKLVDGDVLVTNHPKCGGTHLPDITVITPVFGIAENGKQQIIFYVASRGHHADIGGILPGSMPPNSTELWQEGVAIEAEKIVSGGAFNEERMIEILHEPAKYPGCEGARCIEDNLSDLRAQIAANHRGISLIKGLIQENGIQEVHSYMLAIQDTAEIAVRNLLRGVAFNPQYGSELFAKDHMDDGSPIYLKITIDKFAGTAIFDFNGTGPEVYGNTNAPEAITHSAIIYCLRCLIDADIPLNQGCLNPIDVRIPPNSLLSPSEDAAVVGGNVLTSQRITDVILKAFKACAASQGCCNNLTFGSGRTTVNIDGKDETVPGFGYYETIAGGSGAGPTWVGASGVHTHMTNTRITDPEVFEKRYPCILRRFSLRTGSGGGRILEGQQGSGLSSRPGGNGCVRDIEFLMPVQCSILSERRSLRPYGMENGPGGALGRNLFIRKIRDDDNEDEYDATNGGGNQAAKTRTINLGGKATVKMSRGDRIVIMTPGGGAWGT